MLKHTATGPQAWVKALPKTGISESSETVSLGDFIEIEITVESGGTVSIATTYPQVDGAPAVAPDLPPSRGWSSGGDRGGRRWCGGGEAVFKAGAERAGEVQGCLEAHCPLPHGSNRGPKHAPQARIRDFSLWS